MQRIFLILFFLLTGFVAFCQTTRSSTPGFSPRANQTFVVEDGDFSARNSLFTPRYADTTEANTYILKDTLGAVIFTYDVMRLWVRTGSPKTWVQIGSNTYTASQGITLSGNDFQLGKLMGSAGSNLTTDREIELDANAIAFNSKISPSIESIGYAYVSINVLDSLTSTAPPSSSLPGTAGRFERTIRVTGPYYAEYKNGFRQALIYEGADSVPIDTKGGDFGGGVVNELRVQPLATHTGRTVFRGGIASLIPVEAPFGGLSQLVVKGHSGSRSYLRGFFTGHTSLMVMDSGQPDSLENFIHYGGRGYAPSPSKVLKSFFMRPTSLVGDSIWFLYDSENYKSYLTGSVAIGGTTGTATASSLLDVTSTTKGVIWPRMTTTQKNAIASPATGLIVFDTDLNEYNFYDGAAWASMGGGGGDVTKVGTPVNNQLGVWTGDGTIEGDANLTFASSTLNIGVAGSATGIFTQSGVTSGTITFQPASAAGTYTLTWPTNDGDADQVLTTNGAGVLSWGTVSGGANTALSNLASVAINTSLLFNADNSYDIGDATNGVKDIYSRTVNLDGSTSGTITLQAAAVAGAATITFPAATGIVGLLGSTQNWTGSNTFSSVLNTTAGLSTDATGTSANFHISSGAGIGGAVTNSRWLFEGAASVQKRSSFNGVTSTVLTANVAYAGVLMAEQPVTEATSGNHALLAGIVLKAPTITGGAGTVSNTATLYIDAAPSATVSDQNSALWIASGNLRLGKAGTAIGTMSFEGNTSGKVTLTPAAAAGTPTFTFGTTTGTIESTLTNTATLDFASTAPSTSTDLTITVTGAADGDAVTIGVPNGSTIANSCFTAWVSAANTVTIRFNNYQTVGDIDPASGTFRASVLKY